MADGGTQPSEDESALYQRVIDARRALRKAEEAGEFSNSQALNDAVSQAEAAHERARQQRWDNTNVMDVKPMGSGGSATEASRAERLKRDQNAAARPGQSGGVLSNLSGRARGAMLGAALALNLPMNAPEPAPREEQTQSMGAEEGEGGDYSPEENLVRSQASAGLAAQNATQQGAPNPEEEIQKQTNSVNHYILQTETELIATDVSTFGISLLVTVPFRLVFCAVLGYQLYNAFTGNESFIPYFPKLTIESFFPPGSKISAPVPPVFVQLAVVAYLIYVGLLTLTCVGLLALLILAITDPLGTAGAIFSFFQTTPGT